jgi:hypothetical protein
VLKFIKALKNAEIPVLKTKLITRSALSIPSNIAEGYERNMKNAIGPYQGAHTLKLEPNPCLTNLTSLAPTSTPIWLNTKARNCCAF